MADVLIQDLVGLVKRKRRWLGCVEWHIRADGSVGVRAGNHLDQQILDRLPERPSMPPVFRQAAAAAAAGGSPPLENDQAGGSSDSDSDGEHGATVFRLYVRAEPGMYINGAARKHVLNISNVSLLLPSMWGRGFFGAMLGRLEAWLMDQGADGPACQGILVQNIVNPRLKQHLLQRRAAADLSWVASEHSDDVSLLLRPTP